MLVDETRVKFPKMTFKRKFESLPDKKNGKRREFSKWDKFAMEYLDQRFPILSEEIFCQLDYQSLARCKEVNVNWWRNILNHRSYWKKIISKELNCNIEIVRDSNELLSLEIVNGNEIYMEWRKAVKKIPLSILRKLAMAATKMNNKIQGYPVHLIAAFGEMETFVFIAEKTKDVNPRCKLK